MIAFFELIVELICDYILIFFKIKKNLILTNLVRGILVSFIFFITMKLLRVFNNISVTVNTLEDLKFCFLVGMGIAFVSLLVDILERRRKKKRKSND